MRIGQEPFAMQVPIGGMLSTDQFKENILTEDEDLVGIRFTQPNAFMAAGFEVDYSSPKVAVSKGRKKQRSYCGRSQTTDFPAHSFSGN